MSLKEELPRNFNLEKSEQEDYNKIKDILQEGSEDLDFTLLDVFVLSAAIGYKEGVGPKELDNPYPLINTRGISDGQFWVLVSLAVEEQGISVLSDVKEIRKISEGYAKSGFPILKKKIEGGAPENKAKRLQKDMLEAVEKG